MARIDLYPLGQDIAALHGQDEIRANESRMVELDTALKAKLETVRLAGAKNISNACIKRVSGPPGNGFRH